MSFSWQDTLSLLGFIQGALLSLLLFTRRRNRRANLVLGFFTLLFSLGLLERFFPRLFPGTGALSLLPDLLGGLVFLYGPLFFLYIRYLLDRPPGRREWLGHLALFIAYNAFFLAFAARDLAGFPPPARENDSGLLEYALVNLLFLQLFFYCFLTLRLIFRETRHAGGATPGALRWTKRLFSLLTFVYILSYLSLQLTVLGFPLGGPLYASVQIGSVVVVYLLSYRALLLPGMDREKNEGEAREKYQGSPLADADKDRYLKSLLDYVEREKPFLNPKLTIEQLAQEIGINRFYLSQIINEKLNRNFSDFINAYRIRETQRLMRSPEYQHLNILGMALESGFNSKSSFNNAFKKLTGMSPSQYRQSVKPAD